LNRPARLRLKVLIFIIFSFFLSLPHSEAEIGEHGLEKILANGLKVILLENHKAPVITFQVWYRVGSRNEEWGKTGLSHMLEHMMFKGTQKVSGSEFSRIIQVNGGNDNAFTSRDFTAYFENLSADRIHVSLDLESDRMQNLVLREEDFRTERMVVMEERRLRTEDNPKAYLLEQVDAAAFQLQPYHWPTVGWMEDLAQLTLDDLKAYYRAFYNPVNAFLVVVGDFKKEDLLPRIEKAFGALPKGVPPDQKKGLDPPQTGERRIIVKREAELPFIVLGYHVPNLREPDSYVLEVIATVLSGGKSSRLHKSLVREKRLVLNAEADNSLLSHDPGLFMISAELLPDKTVTEVEKALDQEVEQLQTGPVEEHELQKVKNQLEASFVFGQDSLFYQGMLLAQHEIALSWRAIDNYIPSILKVTPEDIQRVAKRYLVPENRTVGILTPLPPREGKPRPPEFSIKTRMVR
jgi:zinc protease